MNKHLFKSCDEIDAALFSGDILYREEEENLEAFKEFLGRWNREVKRVEETNGGNNEI